MLRIWAYKGGKREEIGSSGINKDLLKGGRYDSKEIALGPKDPSDPDGKRRLDVDDKDKDHFVLLKFYSATPAQKPNYRGEMEDVPLVTIWIPREIAVEEMRYYLGELGIK